jgi:Phospholipase_D-nuclease N-terminal/Short C-terminal domain
VAPAAGSDDDADLGNRDNSLESRYMVFATSYPFLGIFWSMLIFFAWVIFIWIAITVLIDLFRRHDMSGFAKAAWVILVIILPFVGVLIYLIAYHQGMADRRVKEVQASQQQFDDYVRTTAGAGGAAGEIEKAKKLLDDGTITQAEFDAIKTKALSAA